MTKNKITIETNEDDFFEYMKFKEAVNRTAVFIYWDMCSKSERLIILDKPKTFEKINEKIKELEENYYGQIQKNNALKDEMKEKLQAEQAISKEAFYQNELLKEALAEKNKRWFEFWKG